MWRISYDFWDDWEALTKQFERCNLWSRYITPGAWPDTDVLPIEKIGLRGEIGTPRQSNFTPNEMRTEDLTDWDPAPTENHAFSTAPIFANIECARWTTTRALHRAFYRLSLTSE